MKRSSALMVLALACAGSALAGGVIAQEAYPSRNITYLVPYNPGGASDVIARLIAQKLEEDTGVTVTVDYRPGAGGAIGANLLANAAPDGYTIMAGTTNFFHIIPRLQNVTYDPETDLVAVAMTGESYLPLVVAPSLPVESFEELVDYARENPRVVKFGSAGVGTGGHLVHSYLQEQFGIEMIHVPYGGASEVLNALASGEVDVGMEAGSAEFVLDGRLRGLAILGPRRWDRLPELPTILEAGVSEWPVRAWHTVLVPGGTSDEVIETLNEKINAYISDPEIVERLQTFGLEPEAMSVEDVAARVEADREAFNAILDAAGL